MLWAPENIDYVQLLARKKLYLTLKLLVANLANTKYSKNPEKSPKPCQMGTHLRVLNENNPMSTNMTGFR